LSAVSTPVVFVHGLWLHSDTGWQDVADTVLDWLKVQV
jgi:hypothetical protein